MPNQRRRAPRVVVSPDAVPREEVTYTQVGSLIGEAERAGSRADSQVAELLALVETAARLTGEDVPATRR